MTRFCRKAILDPNSEEASSTIITQRWWLRWSEWSNWLALSDEPFSFLRQMADSPQDMPPKKHYILSACQSSAFHSQTLDIRH
jgi:hypothetical protein